MTSGDACVGTHAHTLSPPGGICSSEPRCKARCSEHFRKGTSLNVFFDKVQALPPSTKSYFSRCGYRAVWGLATSRLPPSCSWAKYHTDDSVCGVQLNFFALSHGFLLNADLQVRQSSRAGGNFRQMKWNIHEITQDLQNHAGSTAGSLGTQNRGDANEDYTSEAVGTRWTVEQMVNNKQRKARSCSCTWSKGTTRGQKRRKGSSAGRGNQERQWANLI